MTNKKSSFLIKFIILSTLVLAFILVLLGIIFNNYSSSKDNKELINIVQQLEISDEKSILFFKIVLILSTTIQVFKQ